MNSRQSTHRIVIRTIDSRLNSQKTGISEEKERILESTQRTTEYGTIVNRLTFLLILNPMHQTTKGNILSIVQKSKRVNNILKHE